MADNHKPEQQLLDADAPRRVAPNELSKAATSVQVLGGQRGSSQARPETADSKNQAGRPGQVEAESKSLPKSEVFDLSREDPRGSKLRDHNPTSKHSSQKHSRLEEASGLGVYQQADSDPKKKLHAPKPDLSLTSEKNPLPTDTLDQHRGRGPSPLSPSNLDLDLYAN